MGAKKKKARHIRPKGSLAKTTEETSGDEADATENAESTPTPEGVTPDAPDCPHLNSASPDRIKDVLKAGNALWCTDCLLSRGGDKGGKKKKSATPRKKKQQAAPPLDLDDVWICLTCGNPVGHAKEHQERSSKHALVMQQTTQRCWCYVCDKEISIPSRTPNCPYEKVRAVADILRSAATGGENGGKKKNRVNQEDVGAEEPVPVSTEPLSFTHDAPGLRGLKNLGNTCFFNSVMQNLVHNIVLRRAAVRLEPVANYGRLSVALLRFLSQMCKENGTGAMSPGNLFQEVIRKAPRFRGMQQQDSHELFHYLIDGVNDEELKRLKLTPKPRPVKDDEDEEEEEAEQEQEEATDDKNDDKERADKSKQEAQDDATKKDAGSEGKKDSAETETTKAVEETNKTPQTEKKEVAAADTKTAMPAATVKSPAPQDLAAPSAASTEPKKSPVAAAPSELATPVAVVTPPVAASSAAVTLPAAPASLSTTEPTKSDDKPKDKPKPAAPLEASSDVTATKSADSASTLAPVPASSHSVSTPSAQPSLAITTASSSSSSSTALPPISSSSPPPSSSDVEPSTHPPAVTPALDAGVIALDPIVSAEEVASVEAAELLPPLVSGSLDAPLSLPHHLKGFPRTFIERVFGGITVSRVTCHTCRRLSDTVESSLDFSLPIQNEAVQHEEPETRTSGRKKKKMTADKLARAQEFQALIEAATGEKVGEGVEEKKADGEGAKADTDAAKDKPSEALSFDARKTEDAARIMSGALSVEHCLWRYTSPEVLSADNAFGCEHCTRAAGQRVTGRTADLVKRRATKQVLIRHMPRLFVLHLKRFHQTARGFSKLSTSVRFGLTLDVSPFCEPGRVPASPVYRLSGVVEHAGGLSSGHYTAYIRNSEKWCYFSDSHFHAVSEAQVLNAEGYLLFYESMEP